jgi:hypothetical protein
MRLLQIRVQWGKEESVEPPVGGSQLPMQLGVLSTDYLHDVVQIMYIVCKNESYFL